MKVWSGRDDEGEGYEPMSQADVAWLVFGLFVGFGLLFLYGWSIFRLVEWLMTK